MSSKPVYYELYDNGELVGEYQAKEIMERFNWKHYQQVTHYSDARILYQGRYQIERIEPPPKPEQIRWAEEWDKTRQRILEGHREYRKRFPDGR